MKKKLIICIGIISLLFGCSKYETIDPQKSWHYVFDPETKTVHYKTPPSGGTATFRNNYAKLATNHPKKMVVLSEQYATDGHLVFNKANTIEKASPKSFILNPKYPNSFAKDTISKTHYYGNEILDLDYRSLIVHSKHYVSDKNTVLYNDGDYDSDTFDKEIPVQDIPSFELIPFNKKNTDNYILAKNKFWTVLVKDKFWLYLENILVPVPSKNTQIIKKTIFLHKDTLHYITRYKKDITYMHKKILSKFKVLDGGIISKSKYDTYYHFKIIGFKNASQVDDSHWLKDDNGLYYINSLNKISEVSKKQYNSYKVDTLYRKYLRTENTLFGMSNFKKGIYSASGKIMSDRVVMDNNTVFYEGEKIENSDAITFIKLKPYGFIDKNYYYRNYDLNTNRFDIPHWAYDELKSGKLKEWELWNIKLGYEYTTYKEYWNGFLVTMKVPRETITNNKLYIEFKNIERKTLSLNAPLEETVFLFFRKKFDDPYNLSTKINTSDVYDYKEIENGKIIAFTIELPENITGKDGKSYSFPYYVTLSNLKKPDSDNYDELYMEADLKLEK